MNGILHFQLSSKMPKGETGRERLEGILRNLCDYCNFVPREECPSPIFDPVGCESPADTHNNLDSMQTVFFPVQITITECTEIDEKVCMFC